MSRLRLEVLASENLNDICNQATRIATQLGIEVVFDLPMLGKDVIAKPGMAPDSLFKECHVEPTIVEDTQTIPRLKKTTEPKVTGKKSGKENDSIPATNSEATPKDVQEGGI